MFVYSDRPAAAKAGLDSNSELNRRFYGARPYENKGTLRGIIHLPGRPSEEIAGRLRRRQARKLQKWIGKIKCSVLHECCHKFVDELQKSLQRSSHSCSHEVNQSNEVQSEHYSGNR